MYVIYWHVSTLLKTHTFDLIIAFTLCFLYIDMTYNIPFEKECSKPKYEIYLSRPITVYYRWGNWGFYLFRDWDIPTGPQIHSWIIQLCYILPMEKGKGGWKSNGVKRKGSVLDHINEKLNSSLKKDGSTWPKLMSLYLILSMSQHYSSLCWLYSQAGCLHRVPLEASYLYSISLQSSGKRASLSYEFHHVWANIELCLTWIIILNQSRYGGK